MTAITLPYPVTEKLFAVPRIQLHVSRKGRQEPVSTRANQVSEGTAAWRPLPFRDQETFLAVWMVAWNRSQRMGHQDRQGDRESCTNREFPWPLL